MQRKWLWLLAVFGIICVASLATASANIVLHDGMAMAEENSFTTANSTPVMTSSETDGMAAERGFDAANIGNTLSMGQPMAADEDGEKKLAAAVQVDRIGVANTAYFNLAVTVDPNATSTAQISPNRTSTRSANPQDAAAFSAQPEVWAPNLTVGADITPSFSGAAHPVNPLLRAEGNVIKWTTPATRIHALS